MIRKPRISEFTRNVLTLLTGTTITQAIPIAISPILTRIYTAEDFGVYALFAALTAILGAISNGRYELAIMLPIKHDYAINIAAFAIIITFFMSLFLLIIVLFFNSSIASILGNEDISIWLFFVPVAVFFTGLFNSLRYYNTRIKSYNDISKALIIKSITLAIIQIVMGFFRVGPGGLISGSVVSNIFANTRLFRNTFSKKNILSQITIAKMKALAKRYIDFPKFSLAAIFANTLSKNLTNIMVSSFYSITTLGFYSFIQRILGVPSSLIGASIGHVYFQAATKEKQKSGSVIITLRSTTKKLILLGFPVFFVLFFVIEDLFSFVFGEEWRIAGQYSQVLIPMFFLRFVSSPIAITTSIYEKQRQALAINIILTLTSISCIVISHILEIDFLLFLKYFSALVSINYFLFIFYYFELAKGKVVTP